MQGLFLSTPSARRATGCCHERVIALEFLSTPSARRATCCPSVLCSSGHISIHALREEGDLFGVAYNVLCAISIHALREEGDFVRFVRNVRIVHFYPRPPRGGRQGLPRDGLPPRKFLSTPSARRATAGLNSGGETFKDFYPRPPRGGRPAVAIQLSKFIPFLSTPSARRATHDL